MKGLPRSTGLKAELARLVSQTASVETHRVLARDSPTLVDRVEDRANVVLETIDDLGLRQPPRPGRSALYRSGDDIGGGFRRAL